MRGISIVVLNWNNYADTKECLTSLSQVTDPDVEIILVDNGSQDGSGERLKSEFPQVKLIANKENLGFTGGNNVGIKYALAQGRKYILLLNNDTVVEPDFLSKLLKSAQADPQVGVLSPKIMFFDQPQKIWFVGGSFRSFLKKPYHPYYGELDNGQNENRPTETGWVSGCCMLVKSEVFTKIGLLDEDYFNNYEDADFCWRAKQAGYKILLVPEAKIYHKFAASVGGKFSPFYTYFRTRNNLCVFPFYSIIESIKHKQFASVSTTLLAIADFMRGKYGKGSIL